MNTSIRSYVLEKDSKIYTTKIPTKVNTTKNEYEYHQKYEYEYHQKWICLWRWHNCTSAEEHVVLGIPIDSRSTFCSHLKQLYKKVAHKLNALTGIDPHLRHNQRRLIHSSFFTGQLSYCPLIWTFCSRQSNNFINKLQELALRIIYNDYYSTFFELLEMPNELTTHIKNIQVLMTEINTFLNDLSPQIMRDKFQRQENYLILRNLRSLVSKQKFTTTYCIDTISFRGSHIWQDLPQDIKNFDSLNLFKSYIKRNGTLTCHYKLCKSFFPYVGYID